MSYRPYPNVDRALKQLARKERVVARRWITPTGQVAEEYDFPGQSLAAVVARMPSQPGRYVLSTLSPGSVSPEVASRFPSEFIEQVNQARRPGAVGGPS
jgi:hypothetical protein